MATFRIRAYGFSDFEALKPILDDALGIDYFDGRLLSSENCLVAESSSVVGMVFGERDGSSAELKTVAVSETCRGQGVASQLVDKFIAAWTRVGVVSFWSPAWVNGDNIPASRLLERSGFIRTKTIADYWTLDSVRRKYACPVCGNPCHCSAVIFERRHQA